MTISALTGRTQALWLRRSIWALAALAAIGLIVPGDIGSVTAGLAVILLIAVPLLRVVGIVVRLATEHDRRFVLVGLALLSVAILGVLISVVLRS
jgi:hypothetical protein